jgi:hypothetical protein
MNWASDVEELLMKESTGMLRAAENLMDPQAAAAPPSSL